MLILILTYFLAKTFPLLLKNFAVNFLLSPATLLRLLELIVDKILNVVVKLYL